MSINVYLLSLIYFLIYLFSYLFIYLFINNFNFIFINILYYYCYYYYFFITTYLNFPCDKVRSSGSVLLRFILYLGI